MAVRDVDAVDRWARYGLRNVVTRRPDVRMIPDTVILDGRRVQFAVSDNADTHGPDGPGSPPVWAVNLHGYLAGGSMYWRESARIAERLGWRVVNPSLPGFGGSEALDWQDASLATVAKQVDLLLAQLGAGPAVLLGHSMGGAVAIQYAVDRPARVLGILYRDGIATPAWRRRRGLVARAVGTVLPNLADYADLFSAFLLDTPDLLAGRMYSTIRSLLPDVRRNLLSVTQVLPLGAMLMTVDLRPEVRRVAETGLPILPEWGCWDRVVTAGTAEEFSRCARVPVQWVPGGHSWMLARPQGQADVLCHVPSGQRFRVAVEDRWRETLRPPPQRAA